MKIVQYKYAALIAVLVIAFQYSCNKLVDLKPINEISDADYWKTPDQFKLAANEFYTYLLSFGGVIYDPPPGGAPSPHSDLRCDLSGARGNAFSNGTNALPVTDAIWNNDYTRLRAINYLLDKAETYPNPSEIAQYVAEAKFFRAYVYFDLLQLYGGVPIVTKPLGINSEDLQKPRASREEVADLIIKDLEEAIPVLSLESVLATANKGRISKGAAQAFLARVSLYEGTWQKFRNGNATRYNSLLDKAVAYSDSVILSNQYQLFTSAALGDSCLRYLFILENEKSNPAGVTKSANKEYILANRYDFNLRQIGLNITHTGLGNSRKMMDLYLCADGLPIERSSVFQGYATTSSEYKNRDRRMTNYHAYEGQITWDNELPGSRTTWLSDAADIAGSRGPLKIGTGTGTGYGSFKWSTERRLNDGQEAYDWPVIRLAKVYLIYAEAKFERNGSISDADLNKSLNLTRLRVNRNMPPLSNALVTGNGLDMRAEIRRERSVELMWEGFRIDDLKRWKTAEIEMPMDILGVRWKGTEYETKWKVNGGSPSPVNADGDLIWETGRVWQQKHYLLPIPTQQIQLNPNLKQNPGWE